MRNELEKFHHTVDILVKAFIKDTLVHHNCYACAVGNLVADAMGYSFVPCRELPGSKKIVWDVTNGFYFQMHHAGWYQTLGLDSVGGETERGKEEIKATGYSPDELVKIESAFENANSGENEDEYMFNGLMAVVDVLADIHQVDLTIKEEAKLLFVK